MTSSSTKFNDDLQNPIWGAFIKNTLGMCGIEVYKYFEIEKIGSGREYAEEKMRELESFFADAKWDWR